MKVINAWSILKVVLVILLLLGISPFEILAKNSNVQITIYNNKNIPIMVRAEKVTGTKAEKGLSGRTRLAPNTGMLFDMNEAYEKWNSEERKEAKNAIWMLDMKFPIDIMWIENGEIIHVVENAPVPYKSHIPYYAIIGHCDYALETNHGFIAKNRVAIGNKVEIKSKKRD